MRVGQDAPVARQEAHLLEEPRHSIRLDHPLNVALQSQPLLRNLELPVPVEMPPQSGPAARSEAAADRGEAGDQSGDAEARVEVFLPLDFVSDSFFGSELAMVMRLSSPPRSCIDVLPIEALEHGLLGDEVLVA